MNVQLLLTKIVSLSCNVAQTVVFHWMRLVWYSFFLKLFIYFK